MRRPAVGLLLAPILVGGPAPAAPPVAEVAKVPAQRIAPAAIDSEASLEFFISTAARLVKADSAKQFALLSDRLKRLKEEKQALARKLQDVQGQRTAAEGARDSARVTSLDRQRETLNAQLANVDLTIRELLLQIQRVEDEERREQDEARNAEEKLRALEASLAASADTQRTVAAAAAGITGTSAFVRRLPAEKRRETQRQVQQALAQLAEARRLRLSLLTSGAGPAFRVAPQPGQKN